MCIPLTEGVDWRCFQSQAQLVNEAELLSLILVTGIGTLYLL